MRNTMKNNDLLNVLSRRIIADSIKQAKYDKIQSKVNKRAMRFVWDSLLYLSIDITRIDYETRQKKQKS